MKCKQQIGHSYICGCIALCSMSPVDYPQFSFFVNDDIAWIKVTMAQFVMFWHALEACRQLITSSCIDILEKIDLICQFVTQCFDCWHSLLMDHQLKVNKLLHVFIHFLWMFFHQLSQSFSLDMLTGDAPAALFFGNCKNLWNIKVCVFLNECFIFCFVEYTGQSIVLVKYLNYLAILLINCFMWSCKDNILF